jgi:hypothetical protein
MTEIAPRMCRNSEDSEGGGERHCSFPSPKLNSSCSGSGQSASNSGAGGSRLGGLVTSPEQGQLAGRSVRGGAEYDEQRVCGSYKRDALSREGLVIDIYLIL